MPSPYRIAKNFPSRKSFVHVTVPLSPVEHRALKTACEVLGYSMAALSRYALSEILAPYLGAAPSVLLGEPSAIGVPLPPPPHPPRPNGLRYDPREYRRLWHAEKLRTQTENAAKAGIEPSRPPRDTGAGVLPATAKGRLAD
jgi:hypothetical protein